MQDHGVLELDVLHPVPVGQGVMISMEYKDKSQQDNHAVVKLYKKSVNNKLFNLIFVKP